MVLLDAVVHFEQVQVIRSDIGPESVEKCRKVENVLISEKRHRDTLRPHFYNIAMFS
jgi:hypothetical protein